MVNETASADGFTDNTAVFLPGKGIVVFAVPNEVDGVGLVP
jgi:hypothetical protein